MSLRYNGIDFVWPQTQINVMGPGRDPSGSDQTFTTIHLKARSLISPGLIPSLAGHSAERTLQRIRHLLTAPRRELYYDLTSLPTPIGGNPIVGQFPIINIPDGRDDANGPWPDADAFSAVYTTPGTIDVTWGCTVNLVDCTPAAGVVTAPLSLRWEDTISFDKYWKAMYRRQGTIIISSRSNLTIDEYRRNKVAPRLAPGFARESANYTISRDGLRCDFLFVDGQVRYAPPYPAVDMDIRQSESGSLLGGLRKGEVGVVMRGAINASPIKLAALCLEVAYARAMAADPLDADKKVIGTSVLQSRESKDSVEVMFSLSYRVKPVPQRTSGARGPASVLRTWSGLVLSGLGLTGIVTSGAIDALADAANRTTEGKEVTKTPIRMGWLGRGTTPQSAQNPLGYATWADPNAAMQQPADGVLLAPFVGLYAALLEDPCGAALAATPFAGASVTTLRTDVSTLNGPAGGNDGTSGNALSQLSASLTTFSAMESPPLNQSTDNEGLYAPDAMVGVYDYWQCLNEYKDDPGDLVIPTCNPNGTNIRVNYSSRMMTLTKRWAASRLGSPPQVPPKTSEDPNLVLVWAAPAVREMDVGEDGVSMLYRAEGIYVYQVLDAAAAVPAAEIPPFLVFGPLTNPSKWLDNTAVVNGYQTQTNRNRNPGSQNPLPPLGSGGSSVLGSGTLSSPMPT